MQHPNQWNEHIIEKIQSVIKLWQTLTHIESLKLEKSIQAQGFFKIDP